MTAVEWLEKQLNSNSIITQTLIKQALEMERQQIEDAHGIKTISINQYMSKLITGEQYYNETFKKITP